MAVRVALSAFLTFICLWRWGSGRFALYAAGTADDSGAPADADQCQLVAALNYLGYLCSSFGAMRAHRRVELRLLAGVWGAVILKLLSACVSGPGCTGLSAS